MNNTYYRNVAKQLKANGDNIILASNIFLLLDEVEPVNQLKAHVKEAFHCFQICHRPGLK